MSLRLPDYFKLPDTARTAVWLWWVGFLLIVVGIIVASFLMIGPAYALLPIDWLAPVGEGARGGFSEYFILFLLFVPMFVMPFVVWQWLHALPFQRLVTATARLRWGSLMRAMVVVILAYALISLIDYRIDPGGYEGLQRQTDWGGYAILLLITLLLCPIQASSEEILLRGYGNHMILQTLTRLRIPATAAIWITYVVTSALFASLHLGNPESEGQVWPYTAGTVLYGLGMCVLVHLENGLESALGYHIANNIFVFSILGYADPTLPNSAIFWVPEIVIGWVDILWELVTMSGLITVILWWNRRSARSSAIAPTPDDSA